MRHYFSIAIFLLISFLSFGIYAQQIKPSTKLFYLDQSIRQNKSIFQFWKGSTDSTSDKLIIKRIQNRKPTIIYNDFIRDGIYKIADRNNDGYKDFISYYHEYEIICFFDYKANSFKQTPVYMPMDFVLLDMAYKIYWGYQDAEYGDSCAYSILYKYKGYKPYFYYQIKYITKEYYAGREYATRIELYKFKNGNYENPVFVRQIKTNNPGKFNYKKYWIKHYKELVGYSQH